MRIFLNGEVTEVPDHLSAADLIQHLELENRRLAMEINQEIVSRSQHAVTPIHADDKVEIVHAIGGG